MRSRRAWSAADDRASAGGRPSVVVARTKFASPASAGEELGVRAIPRSSQRRVSVDDFPAPGKPDGAPVALAPPVADVLLWWAVLTASDAEVARVSGWLAPGEHARAARFGRQVLSPRYILGRALLRWDLGNAFGLQPPAVHIQRGVRG